MKHPAAYINLGNFLFMTSLKSKLQNGRSEIGVNILPSGDLELSIPHDLGECLNATDSSAATSDDARSWDAVGIPLEMDPDTGDVITAIPAKGLKQLFDEKGDTPYIPLVSEESDISSGTGVFTPIGVQ